MTAGKAFSLCTFILSALCCVAGVCEDASVVKPASYYHDVRPILVKACHGCHQPAKASGKINLLGYGQLLKAFHDDKKVVVPGKPETSLLYKEILPDGDKGPAMPKNAEPLSSPEVGLIKRWILEGAKDDTPESAKDNISQSNPPQYQGLPVITSLDYSSDGKYLAVSGYHEVLLHKADGSALEARLVGISQRIQSVAFSPDGKMLAVSGGLPAQRGEIQIWNVETRKLKISVPSTYDTLYGVKWSHDGKLVSFGAADNTLRAIASKTGKQVFFNGAHNDWVPDTVFSKDSSHLISVSRDRSMKLMKVDAQQFIDNITSITPGALKGGLMAIDRHPGKDELLIGGADGVPKIYRMFRQKARKIGDDYNRIKNFAKLPGRIFSIEYSADGGRIVAGSSKEGEGLVRVYQEGDAKQLWELKVAGGIYTCAFAHDGKTVAAAGFQGKVLLVDAASGKILKELIPVPLKTAG